MLKACRRVAQGPGPAAAAPFSSAPSRRPEAFEFNQERKKFNEDMSLKRKAYAAEVAARVAEEAKRVKDERAAIVAAKLERLQIKIERSRIRAQSVAIEKAAVVAAFEERRVITDAKREAKEAEADLRRGALVAYLEEQARGWLTPQRAELELTADFFAAPWGLAGACKERSPYWGYVAETEQLYPDGTILASNNRVARKQAAAEADAEAAAAAAPAAAAAAVETKVAAGAEPAAAAAAVRQEVAAAARAAKDASFGHVKGALRTRRDAVNLANMMLEANAATYREFKGMRENPDTMEEFVEMMQTAEIEDEDDPKGYVGSFGGALGGPRAGGFGGARAGGFGGGGGGFGGGSNLASRGGGIGMPAKPPADPDAQDQLERLRAHRTRPPVPGAPAEAAPPPTA